MPNLQDLVMSLVLDFRVDAAGLSNINKGFGALKKIETQAMSAARKGTVDLTRALDKSLTSMTRGEEAAIKFHREGRDVDLDFFRLIFLRYLLRSAIAILTAF